MVELWKNLIQPQPMFEILSRASDIERSGKYVARMEIGGTGGFENPAINALLAKHSYGSHQYSPSGGEPLLIDAVRSSQWSEQIANDYEITIGPANFLITAALAAVTSRGDWVLLPDPGFPTYKLACDFLGLNVAYYSSFELLSNSTEVFQNVGTLECPTPKAVIINNPSNPLGLAADGVTISKMLKKLEVSNTQIILDETYVNLVYSDINPIVSTPNSIRIRTFSKEYCAPGLRIGYVLSNSDVSNTIKNFMSLTISCVPSFIQLAVAEYLCSPARLEFTEQVRDGMSRRFNFFKSAIPKQMLPIPPNSAFYAFLRIGNDKLAFEYLLSQQVSTCPGTKFGKNGLNWIRVSLAGLESTFEKDVSMLSNALSGWQH
jgi:aspartate aminotransferase